MVQHRAIAVRHLMASASSSTLSQLPLGYKTPRNDEELPLGDETWGQNEELHPLASAASSTPPQLPLGGETPRNKEELLLGGETLRTKEELLLGYKTPRNKIRNETKRNETKLNEM